MNLQQIPLVAAFEQAHTPLGESDEVVLRLLQLEQIHIKPLVNGAAVKDELVRRNGKQRLGEAMMRLDSFLRTRLRVLRIYSMMVVPTDTLSDSHTYSSSSAAVVLPMVSRRSDI